MNTELNGTQTISCSRVREHRRECEEILEDSFQQQMSKEMSLSGVDIKSGELNKVRTELRIRSSIDNNKIMLRLFRYSLFNA